jgi:hypothetical protein
MSQNERKINYIKNSNERRKKKKINKQKRTNKTNLTISNH